MRPKTGLDKDVYDDVFGKWNETSKFLEKVIDLLTFMLPHYKRAGKKPVSYCDWVHWWSTSFRSID